MADTPSKQSKRPFGKTLLLYGIMFFVMALALELSSIVFIHIWYHDFWEETLQYQGKSSTVYLVKKFILKAGPNNDFERKSSSPQPFRIPDSIHGFRANTGSFEITYRKPSFDTFVQFKHFVTILPEGNRYVGEPAYPTERDVYVFGDSFIFGEGVNDEQTFTYLLQSRFPHTRFHLYAYSSYSLTNAYLNIQRLSSRIGPEDVIILGHARFYDVRHVAAPSRIKWWGEPFAVGNDPKRFKHLRARLEGDSLVFDRIPLFCAYQQDYCSQPDPPTAYMNKVTAHLINGIARSTPAKVYLLHFFGELRPDIVTQLDPAVSIIQATAETYDYQMRDDINGFDPHPGPYWNHAIYRRLADTLRTREMY
ncbi:MAG: hypothetical protein FJX89_00555 [Bacteroidetes bacterium]|nr:hypothetical protein [Bacteroidota bacterium]